MGKLTLSRITGSLRPVVDPLQIHAVRVSGHYAVCSPTLLQTSALLQSFGTVIQERMRHLGLEANYDQLGAP